jgi:hypothetical protein
VETGNACSSNQAWSKLCGPLEFVQRKRCSAACAEAHLNALDLVGTRNSARKEFAVSAVYISPVDILRGYRGAELVWDCTGYPSCAVISGRLEGDPFLNGKFQTFSLLQNPLLLQKPGALVQPDDPVSSIG